ncbi:Yqey-like protein-domain-containing protein [Xylaria palmicola]|nr:Yqey-like protein-domain-containing protein [Xylaria palmicola]
MVLPRSLARARLPSSLLRPRVVPIPVLAPTMIRAYSDAAPPPAAPPLLQKLKTDLKGAMRAKDAARLSVLRAALAATLNASKTASPVTTDAALVALLRRQARGCAEARDEFAAAGRADLADKEAAQLAVLGEYLAGSGVEELGGDRLRGLVADAAAALGEAPRMGDVMKALLAPGGPLDGKDVEKAELARVVKQVLGA